MSNELTENLSERKAPTTEPTITTLMEQLRSLQDLIDRRHIESQELITAVRDDVNQKAQQKYELLVNRIELLHHATDAHFRKQDHIIHALNDSVLDTRGDQRELFQRIAALEEKAS